MKGKEKNNRTQIRKKGNSSASARHSAVEYLNIWVLFYYYFSFLTVILQQKNYSDTFGFLSIAR